MSYDFHYSPFDILDYHSFVAPQLDPRTRRIMGAKAFLRGPAWTARLNGEIMACWGFAPMHSGVAEAWAMFNPKLQELKLTRYTVRVTKKVFSAIVASGLYHRIHGLCPEDFKRGRRLMEHLGMHFEGVMLKFGPNQETWVRYVIFP